MPPHADDRPGAPMEGVPTPLPAAESPSPPPALPVAAGAIPPTPVSPSASLPLPTGGAMPAYTPSAAPPPRPILAPQTDLAAVLSRWLSAQQPRLYWRVLAGGVVGLFVIWYLLLDKLQFSLLVPFYDLAFALLVPATVALYWWEQGAPDLAPRDALRIALAGGALAGLLATLVLYDLLNLGGGSLLDSIVVAVVEEVLKVAAVAYLLLDGRLRREMDGLILGFVAMLGFSTLQTASYGLVTFLQSNTGGSVFFRPALANMDSVLAGQLLLQLFGDWVWTAILCAAIWRERGTATFAFTRGVGIAFGIVVVLHALWSYSLNNNWLRLYLPLHGYLPIFALLVAVVGLLVLSFFVWESLQRAALGPDAPPPPPLEQALPAHLADLPGRLSGRA